MHLENIEPEESGEASETAEELYERMSLVVDKGQEPLRLDKFLVARVEGASRNKVQKAIESGRVTVNTKVVPPNYKIKPKDEIIVYSDREVQGEEIIPENIPLDIVYEDAEILIINKHVGMVVHPACGNPNGTLINGVAHHLR